nr:hypothetical protein [uncultured Mucilaginibacter sp.]
MTAIKNVHPLSAEELFDILKKDFADYINAKMDSSLSIEYAHVYDIINVSFPEIIEGTVFTITVSEDELVLSNNGDSAEYQTSVLEQHLHDFLVEKSS